MLQGTLHITLSSTGEGHKARALLYTCRPDKTHTYTQLNTPWLWHMTLHYSLMLPKVQNYFNYLLMVRNTERKTEEMSWQLEKSITSLEDDLLADTLRAMSGVWARADAKFPPAITEMYWEMGLTTTYWFFTSAFWELISQVEFRLNTNITLLSWRTCWMTCDSTIFWCKVVVSLVY